MATATCSAAAVLARIRAGDTIRDAEVSESLGLRAIAEGDYVRREVRFANCRLTALDIACLHFECLVAFEGCSFGELAGFAAYFLGGLTVQRCVFESRVDLSCGGHNQNGTSVLFTECRFGDFVDFSDCWFQGPVLITRCAFDAGSNLLGNHGRPYAVKFDVPPTIDANSGNLGIDD